MAAQGQRVLVVDLDPQATASRWLGSDGQHTALADVLAGRARLSEALEASTVEGVTLVPSAPGLAAEAAALPPDAVLALGPELADVAAAFDVALLDTPPALGTLSLAALFAASGVLVMAEPSGPAIEALAELVTTLERVQSRRADGGPALVGVLPVRTDTRQRLTQDILAALERRFGPALMTAGIRESVRHREAATLRRPVIELYPESTAAEDYRAAASELLERMEAS
jgi:chromosome partitioning protein